MPSDSTQSPKFLDYGHAPSRRRRIFRTILLAMFLATAFAAWRWGPMAFTRARILYLQRKCMNYTAPADMVVYEADPTAAAKLLASNKGYAAYNPWRVVSGVTIAKPNEAAFFPDCWKSLSSLAGINTMHAMLHTNKSGGILFLHQLTSPAGHRRLVAVEFEEEYVSNGAGFSTMSYLMSFVSRTGGIRASPTISGPAFPIASVSPMKGVRVLPKARIFAGQLDPAAPWHFTIRYQVWGREDVMDGNLMDNEMVMIAPRNQPVEPRE